jgi:hypothetical protein
MDPITLAVMSAINLGIGVYSGIETNKQYQSQIDAMASQTNNAIAERDRQAAKLLSDQQASFLKSGVYFEGTPQAVFDETYNTAIADINAMKDDYTSKAKTIAREGKTQFYKKIASALASSASMAITGGLGAGGGSGAQFNINGMQASGGLAGDTGGVMIA